VPPNAIQGPRPEETPFAKAIGWASERISFRNLHGGESLTPVVSRRSSAILPPFLRDYDVEHRAAGVLPPRSGPSRRMEGAPAHQTFCSGRRRDDPRFRLGSAGPVFGPNCENAVPVLFGPRLVIGPESRLATRASTPGPQQGLRQLRHFSAPDGTAGSCRNEVSATCAVLARSRLLTEAFCCIAHGSCGPDSPFGEQE